MPYSPDDHPDKRRRETSWRLLTLLVALPAAILAVLLIVNQIGISPFAPRLSGDGSEIVEQGPIDQFSAVWLGAPDSRFENQRARDAIIRNDNSSLVDLHVGWAARDGNGSLIVGRCEIRVTVENYDDQDLYYQSESSRSCSTGDDDDGRLNGDDAVRFDGLPPGKYNVTIRSIDDDVRIVRTFNVD